MPIEVLNKGLFNSNDYRVFSTLVSLKEKEIQKQDYIVIGDEIFEVLTKPSDEGVIPYNGMSREQVIASLNKMTQVIKFGSGRGQIDYKLIDKVEDGTENDIKVYFSSKFLKEFRGSMSMR